MAKFEYVGIKLQVESRNASEATRRFSYSCQECLRRGLQIECDSCPIKEAHKEVMGFHTGRGFSITQVVMVVATTRKV